MPRIRYCHCINTHKPTWYPNSTFICPVCKAVWRATRGDNSKKIRRLETSDRLGDALTSLQTSVSDWDAFCRAVKVLPDWDNYLLLSSTKDAIAKLTKLQEELTK